MVIDTSALVAILNNEPERSRFLSAIGAAPSRHMSALLLYETRIVVLARLGDDGLDELAKLLDEFDFAIVGFDRAQAELALNAYRQFGKGFGSPAALNLCDCAAYALAKQLEVPLLYKGIDFVATDILAAV